MILLGTELGMEWNSGLNGWIDQMWSLVDWIWAVGWFMAGVLLTQLLWWKRTRRLTTREREAQNRLVLLERRQKEIRGQMEELSEREATFRHLEESLKTQSAQLKPQIEQLRTWVEQIARREETVTLREAALERKTTLGESSAGG